MIRDLAIDAGAAVVGACVGSYASTLAVRLARAEQSAFGRSRCDGCGTPLGFAQTVPVVSYVRRGGVCAACGGRIDSLHLVGELGGAATALLAVALAPPFRGEILAALGLVLLTSALIDAKTRRLPDALTLVVGALGGVLAYERGGGSGLLIGVLAAAATFLVMETVRRGFLWRRGKAGLGFGDVKLAAALALWLGLATPWAVVVASALGLAMFVLVRPRDGRMPFGPALALGGFLVGLLLEARLWPLP